jgi:apolipoprotein N-acyltransferase
MAGRLVLGLALSLLTAVLMMVAFLGGAWPLVFVAFVPVFVASHRVLPFRYSGLAWGAAGALFTWAVVSRVLQGTSGSAWLLGLAAVAALTLAGYVHRWFHERTGYRWFVVGAPVAAAALAVAPEAPQVATWISMANMFYAHPLVLQPIHLLGMDFFNAMLIMVSTTVAAFLIPEARRHVRRWVPVTLALWLAWLGASAVMLESPRPTVRVAAVHLYSRGMYVRGDGPRILDRLDAMTRSAARGGAKLVVWHETVLPFDPRGSKYAPGLKQLTAETGVYLVTGFFTPRGLNQATVLTPDGRFLGAYGKQHPVTMLGERSHPTPVPVYRTDLGRLATIICYDLDFTDTSRDAARRGAELVAVPSWDWKSIAHLHYRNLVMRAIENRLTMIKADGGYDSAIIDPYGRILAKTVTPNGGDQVLVADVPLGAGQPLSRAREVFTYACVLAVLTTVALLIRSRRRTA